LKKKPEKKAAVPVKTVKKPARKPPATAKKQPPVPVKKRAAAILKKQPAVPAKKPIAAAMKKKPAVSAKKPPAAAIKKQPSPAKKIKSEPAGKVAKSAVSSVMLKELVARALADDAKISHEKFMDFLSENNLLPKKKEISAHLVSLNIRILKKKSASTTTS
jgi:hypothetical protein